MAAIDLLSQIIISAKFAIFLCCLLNLKRNAQKISVYKRILFKLKLKLAIEYLTLQVTNLYIQQSGSALRNLTFVAFRI